MFWHVMVLLSFLPAPVSEWGLETAPRRPFAAVNPMALGHQWYTECFVWLHSYINMQTRRGSSHAIQHDNRSSPTLASVSTPFGASPFLPSGPTSTTWDSVKYPIIWEFDFMDGMNVWTQWEHALLWVQRSSRVTENFQEVHDCNSHRKWRVHGLK